MVQSTTDKLIAFTAIIILAWWGWGGFVGGKRIGWFAANIGRFISSSVGRFIGTTSTAALPRCTRLIGTIDNYFSSLQQSISIICTSFCLPAAFAI